MTWIYLFIYLLSQASWLGKNIGFSASNLRVVPCLFLSHQMIFSLRKKWGTKWQLWLFKVIKEENMCACTYLFISLSLFCILCWGYEAYWTFFWALKVYPMSLRHQSWNGNRTTKLHLKVNKIMLVFSVVTEC